MLTRWSPWQLQAVNRIQRQVGLDTVYFEGRQPPYSANRPLSLPMRIWNRKELLLRPQAIAARLYSDIQQRIVPSCTLGTMQKKVMKEVYAQLFSDPWDHVVDPSLPLFFVKEKSFDSRSIRERSPDIVIVFGTSLLPPEIIAIPARACLNLHWGLSPYYRGAHCTDWSLINDDIQNIGVTIHLLDANIDTGPILAQARPSILPTDTPFSIDMKLSVLGVDLMLNILSLITGGKCLLAHPQKWSAGKTYYLKQWSSKVERSLAKKLQRGRVAPMCRQRYMQTRQMHPIVQLTEVPCEDMPGRIVMGSCFPE